MHVSIVTTSIECWRVEQGERRCIRTFPSGCCCPQPRSRRCVVATGALVGSAAGTSNSPQLKVALIAPSAHNDLAFTQSMYAALNSLKAKYNFKLSVSENQFVVADAANVIRQYASEGYNLIIAHGSQYGGTIQALAPKYPKVSFAWGTASSTFGPPNVYAYQAASNQGGYVQGYIAALLSKTKVIGEIGPIAVGDAKLYVDGFKAGALAASPEGERRRQLHRLVQRSEPHVQAGDASTWPRRRTF